MPKKRRSDGLFEIARKMPDGKVKHFYGHSRAECESKYHTALVEFKAQQTERAAGPLFEDVAREWWEQAQPGLKAGTLRSYKASYAAAVEHFSGRRMPDIKPQDVSLYLKKLKARGLAQGTMRNRHSVLNLIFAHWCTDMGGDANPSLLVRNLKGQKAERTPPDDAAAEKMLQHPDGKMGLLAVTAMYTGLRLGEIMALTWGDVDLPGRMLSVAKSVSWSGNRPVVTTPKTKNAVRQVPILEPLAVRLEAEGRHPDGEYLISGTSEPLTASQHRKRWLAYCKELGLAHDVGEYKAYKGKRQAHWHVDVTAHQLRHYCATLLDKAGVSMKARQLWLGHADIHTTMQIYTHSYTGEMQQAKAEMDKIVNKSQLSENNR